MRPMVLWPTVVALAGLAATATVALTELQFAIRSAEGRIFLETAQMIIAGLVAYMLFGRVVRSGLQRHLLIAAAFSIFALTSGIFIGLRLEGGLVEGSQLERIVIWAPLLSRTIAVGLLAAASMIHAQRKASSRRGTPLMLFALGVVTVTTAGVAVMADHLPSGISDELLLDASRVPGINANPTFQALQILLVLLYVMAAFGLMRHRDGPSDPFEVTLAAGFTAAAFARLNFYLYPSIYSDVVHLGDFLRLLYFILLLIGTVIEINRYWQVETEASALRERERLARELHDGLTQELAFISSQTAAMSKGTSYPQMAGLVSEAAGRAVTESRALLVTLRGESHVNARDALTAGAVRVIGSRADVSVDVPSGLRLTSHMSHELGRIVLEASTNAVTHGSATAIQVEASVRNGEVTLRVCDDGTGFDPTMPSGGQGLTGIRERAALLDGTCDIGSVVGQGTIVEVVVPLP